ncbi:phage tail assembly chaperone [Thermotalea metallivorans]|uniref:Phage portal protein n=1 Tax=Thermotalea metallivorans TaxID=520762 RepID=A0A140LCL4_9FIRM|nr:phage portal protein [Thermotalea metallivorans]KXG78289.1 hypothetical protein AN619_02640 [Thermotalea metallivorans]
MSGLSAFFAENIAQNETIKYVVSKRFTENGKPIEWEIKAITSDEDEAIRKLCTRKVPVPGKKNVFTQEIDFNKYLGMLAVACTVYPNLNDASLQDSYKVMGADNLLKKMLLPGEYADYLKKIQEINGFETSMEDLVDEVKN